MSDDEYDYELNGEECLKQCNDVILSGGKLCCPDNHGGYSHLTDWEYHPELLFINRGYWDFDVKIYTLTLTEYRRLWMLFEAEGCNDKEFIRNFYAGDYEMCAEWMRYVRDIQKEIKAGDVMRIKKYAKRFGLNPKDMIYFMFPNQEYMQFLIDRLTYNDEDMYYRHTKRGRPYKELYIDTEQFIGDFDEKFHGKLYVCEVKKLRDMLDIKPEWGMKEQCIKNKLVS